jgi:hypothetical protein
MFGEFPSPLPDGGGSLCAWRTRQSRRTHDKPSHGKSYLYSWPNCGHTTSFAVSQSWHTAQKKVTDGLTTRFAMCHHAGTRQSLIVCRVPGLGVGVSVGLAFVVCPVFTVCCSRQRFEFAVYLVFAVCNTRQRPGIPCAWRLPCAWAGHTTNPAFAMCCSW